MKKKRKLALLLALCMIVSLFQGMPANAAWDEEGQYGLIVVESPITWNEEEAREEFVQTEDGCPGYYNEEGEVIEITDYADGEVFTSFKGMRYWFGYIESAGEKPYPVSVEDLKVSYYGDSHPRVESLPDAVGSDAEGALEDDEEISGLVFFSPVEGKGWYEITYTKGVNHDESDALVIYVDYPKSGFYSKPEGYLENNLILDLGKINSASNYTFYYDVSEGPYSDFNIVYLNVCDIDGDIQTELADEKPFALSLFGDGSAQLYGEEDGIKNADGEYLLEVETVGDKTEEMQKVGGIWYKLTFADSPMFTPDFEQEEREPVLAHDFDLIVNLKQTSIEDENPVYSTYSLELQGSYDYLGLHAQTEDGLYPLYPDSFNMSLYSLDVNDGMVEMNQVTEPAKIKITRFDAESGEERVAEKGENKDYTVENVADCEYRFTFYRQGNYRISVDGVDGYSEISVWLDPLDFFNVSQRPGDDDLVTGRLKEITVDEGKSEKVYVLAFIHDENVWAVDPNSIYVYSTDGENEKLNLVDIEDGSGRIGIEVEITNQVRDDFTIAAEADYWIGEHGYRELPVKVNRIKELKITTPPAKTGYNAGEKFDAKGMVVSVVYEDGKVEPITDYTIDLTGELKTSDKAVTITYLGRYQVSQSITVNTIPVSGVTLSKTKLELKVGASETLTATVTPANATDKTVTWKSSDTAVATVSSAGKVTAKKAGTAKITATAGGKSITCTVTVTQPVTKVALSKKTATIAKGNTLTLTATVTPSNATNKTVTWKSSDTKVATVRNGKVTAKAAGTAKITATAGEKSATCTITVAAVTLNAEKTTVQVGKSSSAVKVAEKFPKNDTVKSYKSQNTKIATVTNKGKVTGKKVGSTTITVTMKSGATATFKVTVQKAKVVTKSLALSTKTLTLLKGKKETLTVTRNPISATEKLTWSTSNNRVATVDKNGKVTAKAAGTATITVKSANGKKATCKVTVPEVKLSNTSATIKVKKTTTIKIKSTSVKGDKVASYKSANEKIATVDKNGKVTGVKEGTTKITVTMKSGATATFTVTVKK